MVVEEVSLEKKGKYFFKLLEKKYLPGLYMYFPV